MASATRPTTATGTARFRTRCRSSTSAPTSMTSSRRRGSGATPAACPAGGPGLAALDDAEAGAVWGAAGKRGIPVVVATLASELPALGRLLERFPDVVVALDHCGFPDLTGGPAFPRAAPLFDLVR